MTKIRIFVFIVITYCVASPETHIFRGLGGAADAIITVTYYCFRTNPPGMRNRAQPPNTVKRKNGPVLSNIGVDYFLKYCIPKLIVHC